MFKLYVDNRGWERLMTSNNESDIVNEMINVSNQTGLYEFFIIDRVNNTDNIYKRTRSEEDFIKYLEEFKALNPDFNRKKKKKAKTKTLK